MIFQTQITAKPTIITVQRKDEEQKETSEFNDKHSTTLWPSVSSKTAKLVQSSTRDLNPSFETQVKEFYHFSKRTPITPRFSSVTPGPFLHTQVKDSNEKHNNFGFEDPAVALTENKDVSGYIDFFTEKDYLVEQGDHASFEDTNDNERSHNELKENERGYSIEYFTTMKKNKELLHGTSTTKQNINNKQNNEDHQIQNDIMTGWTSTPAPPLFHKELLETRFPRKSTVQKERSVNQVTETKIPYHEVHVSSLQMKPQKLEEIRLFSKDKPPRDVENTFRLEKDNTVVVKTIYSSIDKNISNAGNEFSEDNYFDTDSAHADYVEKDEGINSNITLISMTNTSSPSTTGQEWQSTPRTILNSMRHVTDSSTNYGHSTKEFKGGSKFGKDLILPKSITKPDPGKFSELDEGNKNLTAKWSDQADQGKLQSLVPFNLKSFATAQFQTGKEYISLVDEDVSVLPLTTTTTTTTPEPRSTRKPETFTIGGLLLKGKRDFYQTIGRNPKPILVTAPVSPDKRRASVHAKEIKSVTWKTEKPPKELVLNSESETNEEVKGSKDNVKDATTVQQSKKEIDRYDEKRMNVLDSTIKYKQGQHKKTAGGNEEILKRQSVRPSNLKGKTVVSKPTTTLPPRNTPIVQKKVNNKDIMWGKNHRFKNHFCLDKSECKMKGKYCQKEQHFRQFIA